MAEERLNSWEVLFRRALELIDSVAEAAEALTTKYIEDAGFVKLYFPEGEIDFIVSGALTPEPAAVETVLGRTVQVETTAEIIAKKVHHRGRDFTARDRFDLALVATREPGALAGMRRILEAKREEIRARIETHDAPLRTTFAALETLDFQPAYEECVATVKKVLGLR